MTEGGLNGKPSHTDRMVTRMIYMAAGLVAIACLTIVYHQFTDIDADDFDDDILLEMPVLGAAAKQPAVEESTTLMPWTHDRVCKHFQLSSMAQIRWSEPVLTEEQLRAALKSGSHVVEIPLVHAEQHDMGTEPVVAWNSTQWTSWRLTFKRVLEIWIESGTTQGLMLTILDPRVGRIALGKARVFQKFGKLTGPVFLGAELLPGPGMAPPTMARIPVPSHVSEAFRQAVPELQSNGLKTHPALTAGTSFLPFDPEVFLRDCQAAMPGTFLVASWSVSIPCPRNYMPNPALIGRRLLRKKATSNKGKGRRAPVPPERTRYTANHMLRMKELLEGSSWDGGVALGVDICHIGRDGSVWQSALLGHNSQIPPESSPLYKKAEPWQLEPWLAMMRGVMTEPAGQSLRSGFSPHALLLNVSDVHGERIVI